jgi:hypothetical protein
MPVPALPAPEKDKHAKEPQDELLVRHVSASSLLPPCVP